MNRLTTLFIGFTLTFISSWLGLVIFPYIYLGQLEPVVDEDTGESFPPALSGLAEQGRQVYASNGCIYCHSQQVRPAHISADIERGWGGRRSVARDYISQKNVYLGTTRTGPDLSNIGVRKRDRMWHYLNLYDPQMVNKKSIMAPYKYLFITQEIKGQGSPNALTLTGRYAPEEGYEVVPTQEAIQLVEYLLSLNQDYSLPEAPND